MPTDTRAAQGKRKRGDAGAPLFIPFGLTPDEPVDLGVLVWDAAAAAYVIAGTGAVVSALMLQRVAADSRAAAAERMSRTVDAFAAGSLTAAALGEGLRAQLLEESTRQYVLGRGGLAAMLSEDWGALAALARVQFRFLDSALEAFERGAISAAMLAGRTPMYLGATHLVLEVARGVAAQVAGLEEERRILTPADHCGDCVDLADRGWQPIGTLPNPGDGSTQCLTNCRCYKVYRKVRSRNVSSDR